MVVFVVSISALVYLAFTSTGSYLPGWFALVVVAFLALASLSIPRFLVLTARSVELHCLVKLEVMPRREIKRVKIVTDHQMRWVVPVPFMGTYGVFGYYGYYIDIRGRKLVKVYARGWNNFVLIEDIYEEVMIVGTRDSQEFVEAFEQFGDVSS